MNSVLAVGRFSLFALRYSPALPGQDDPGGSGNQDGRVRRPGIHQVGGNNVKSGCYSNTKIVILGVVALIAGIGCSPSGSFKVTALPADQSLKERITYRHPGWVRNRIAVIDISGVLMNGRKFGLLSEGEHVVSFIVEQLQKAASDKRVKAVVLRINSPGGTVTASDVLYQEILSFKEKTGKPVVAFFQDVAASGAYYLACAADEIVAERSTVTGSIGVIMQMADLSQTLAKLGIRTDAIKSGGFKDAGSPFRKMSSTERAVFQAMVDGFYAQFLDVVAVGRPGLSRDEIVKLADGRVYIAQQALESGLIDRIATMREAIEYGATGYLPSFPYRRT